MFSVFAGLPFDPGEIDLFRKGGVQKQDIGVPVFFRFQKIVADAGIQLFPARFRERTPEVAETVPQGGFFR